MSRNHAHASVELHTHPNTPVIDQCYGLTVPSHGISAVMRWYRSVFSLDSRLQISTNLDSSEGCSNLFSLLHLLAHKLRNVHNVPLNLWRDYWCEGYRHTCFEASPHPYNH